MSVDAVALNESVSVEKWDAIESAKADGAVVWVGQATVEKFLPGEDAPYEVVESDPNLLVYGGASVLWEKLIGAAGGGAAFDNGNAYIGVGDSTTAAAATQTDLVATTNKLRKGQDATYPQHTDSASNAAAATVTFRATFAQAEGNFAWNEVALFNAATGGRMLNRLISSLGTKTSASSWTITLTLTLQ